MDELEQKVDDLLYADACAECDICGRVFYEHEREEPCSLPSREDRSRRVSMTANTSQIKPWKRSRGQRFRTTLLYSMPGLAIYNACLAALLHHWWIAIFLALMAGWCFREAICLLGLDDEIACQRGHIQQLEAEVAELHKETERLGMGQPNPPSDDAGS